MYSEDLDQVNQLDRDGKHQEAFDLLCSLGDNNNPMALFELSSRYYCSESIEPKVLALDSDIDISKKFAESGKKELELMAEENGEAMRMLAYLYFGHLCPHYKDVELAEMHLKKSISAGCHFASNDLATYYRSIDITKARYWYKYAEEHNCRVIANPELDS